MMLLYEMLLNIDIYPKSSKRRTSNIQSHKINDTEIVEILSEDIISQKAEDARI